MTRLEVFDERIAARVAAIRAVRSDWPCRRGCDACCRSLARPLALTAAEWARIDAAVARLDEDARRKVEGNVQSLLRRIESREEPGRVVCPYLDESQGACRIYDARPLACRTYGFFVTRDGPEYCSIIEEDVAERGEAGITWGNAASLEDEVARALGPEVAFDEHFRDWRTGCS